MVEHRLSKSIAIASEFDLQILLSQSTWSSNQEAHPLLWSALISSMISASYQVKTTKNWSTLDTHYQFSSYTRFYSAPSPHFGKLKRLCSTYPLSLIAKNQPT